MLRQIILLIIPLGLIIEAHASTNAFYITLSNQIAKRRQLEVVANNTANTSTIGFEADSVLFNKYEVKESIKKKNAFVLDTATYRSENEGALQRTNRSLDLAIIGKDNYFKVQTPRGERYTLNGSLFINAQGIIVDASGYSYLSPDNEIITIPEEITNLEITKDGIFIADGEEIGQIGVFLLSEQYEVYKEGKGLLVSRVPDVIAENYTVLNNTLRQSNVNPTKVMTSMIELQRSIEMSSNLMSELNSLQNSALQKIGN